MAESPADHPPLVIGGIDLRVVAAAPGPFSSLYLSMGSARKRAAADLLTNAGAGDAEVARVLDELSDDCQSSQVIITAPELPVHRFELLSPLHFDIARYSDSPAFGPLIEAFQGTTSHAVVTVEDGLYGLATFGSWQFPDAEPTSGSISSSIDAIVEGLRFSTPRIIALAGSEPDLEVLSDALRASFPLCWIQHYPTEHLDADLDRLSDQVIRDAESRSAEAITHMLGQFRAARDAGKTVEGEAALLALDRGLADYLLIHDDPFDDRAIGQGRLIDQCLKAAILHRCQVTMIPMVPVEQGPAGSIGVVLRGDGAAVLVAGQGPQLATVTTADEESA